MYMTFETRWNLIMFLFRPQTEIKKTPWKAILTSLPMWGLVFGQISHDWSLFMINADLPKYMKSVLKFSIAEVCTANNYYFKCRQHIMTWTWFLLKFVQGIIFSAPFLNFKLVYYSEFLKMKYIINKEDNNIIYQNVLKIYQKLWSFRVITITQYLEYA